MPRKPKAQPASAAVIPTSALVASAHRYTGKVPRIYSPSKEWQKRTYHHYSHCGEARFASRYFGHAMSRAVLYIGDADKQPVEGGATSEDLAALFSGSDGQEQMLEMVGVHLIVGGECYLVGRNIDGVDIWEVLSPLEIEDGPNGWRILSQEDGMYVELDDAATIIRVWTPKPDRRWEADSPFRSMLPILDEIEWLSRYIHSQTTSRLTGAGVLVLPDNMTFPPPPPKDGQEQVTTNEAEGFTLTLGHNMMEPISNPASPAAQVPLVVTAPGEYIGDIKHLTFWTPLDENALGMRKEALHRFAVGMDLPNEMIEGMSSNQGTGGGNSNGVSHWGAWMIEEQAIKLHIEPMLDVLCAALTIYYIRPLNEGTTDRVLADTSTLRLRPDRSQESVELADRGWLKPQIAVVENGFDVEDMPSEEERREWLLMKIASGSSTPEQVQAALILLGVQLPIAPPAPDAPPALEAPPRESRPAPSLDDHPRRPRTPAENPDNDDYRVYEGLVLRALERAGNKLRSITQSKPPGSSFEAHTHLAAGDNAGKCMADAFPTAEIQLGATRAEIVVPILDSYCKALLNNQQPYVRTSLIEWCQEAGL